MLKCPQESVQFFLKKISRMKKSSEVVGFYDFGDFRLDCATRTLWRDSELIPLPPKVFDTLCILVEKQGKIVSKQEIIDSVWEDSFVEEGNLTQNIYMLRRILGVNENGKSFIETLSRKGYRFTAEVKLTASNGEPLNIDYSENVKSEVVSAQNAASKTNHRFRYLIPVAVGIFLISLLAFFSFYSKSSKKDVLNAPLQKMEFKQMTFNGDANYPVIAPAGDSFAYIAKSGIVIQESDSEKANNIDIPGENEFSHLQFSPDGKTINYRNKNSLFVPADVFQVSRFGGEKKKIAENVWSGFSFSPNGNYLAFARLYSDTARSALIIKNLVSGEEREVVVFDSPSRFIRNSFPAWSPDGSKIAMAISREIIHIADSHLAVFNVANGAIEEFKLPQLKQFEQVVWFPEGNSLAIVAHENKKTFQIWEVSYPEAKLRRITNDGNIYRSLSLSSDGKKMFIGLFSTSSNIWKIEKSDTENPRQITSGNLNRNGVVGLALTKNDEIIYSSRITGNIDLWKTDLQGDSKQQLTKNAGDVNSQPVASPDGKFIYFNSNRSGNLQIWRMDAETAENQTQITFGDKESMLFPQISPDGNILYYVKKGEKKKAIWRKYLDSGKEEILLIEGNLNPVIELSLSPDGKYLATCNISEGSDEENTNQPIQIAIISTMQISQPMIFTTTGCQVVWRENSKAFNYAENTDKGAKIWQQTLIANEKPEMILNIKYAKINHFAWTSNENNLVYSNGIQNMDAMQLVDFR